MQSVSKVLDKLYLACAWISGSLLILLCSLVVWSILSRVFGFFSGGVTDVAGYVMATSTFMALAYTFRTHAHIRVGLILNRFHGRARKILDLFCYAVMSAVTIFLAYYMILLTYDSWEFEERSEGADAILIWIPQFPVAVGASFFALAVIHSFVERIFSPVEQEEVIEPHEV